MRWLLPPVLGVAVCGCSSTKPEESRPGDSPAIVGGGQLSVAEPNLEGPETTGTESGVGQGGSPSVVDSEAGTSNAGAAGAVGPPEPAVTIFDEADALDLSDSSGASNGSCTSICSGDLRSILDCDGSVIETCQAGFACLGSECVEDSCLAAEESHSTLGCDYWAIKTDSTAPPVRSACFAAYVTNTWSVPISIEVSWRDQVFTDGSFIRIPRGQGAALSYEPYDPNVGLPVDEVAIVFLAHDAESGESPATCPVPPAVEGQVGVFYTGRGAAFRIQTSGPVSAHSMMPFGGGTAWATSASLLLPTSGWGKEYIAVNAYRMSYEGGDYGQPSLNILAREDDTQVTLLPGVEVLAGEGVVGGEAGTPLSFVINRGEYVQISQDEELTGSPIAANKPIGVWGAGSCLNVPFDVDACDSAHQQLPPLQSMGSEYVAVRYRNRSAADAIGLEEAPPWRIVGAVNGTDLVWEPGQPMGAPTQVNAGDVFEFKHTGPFVVRSQDSDHPFYVGQYMTGADSIDADSAEGDPEWVNVTPSAQYLNRYVFFTDPTYSETSLVVVRTAQDGSFSPVTLDCAGVLSGWQAVGPYEYTRVQLVTGDFENVGACSNGRHEILSDAPFGVTVWGWGTLGTDPDTRYVSYAYPAGAGLRTITEASVPDVIILR